MSVFFFLYYFCNVIYGESLVYYDVDVILCILRGNWGKLFWVLLVWGSFKYEVF